MKINWVKINDNKHLLRLTRVDMSIGWFKINFKLTLSNNQDENIGNYGYINTSILRIYQKYWRNIGGYFFTNIGGVKII